MSDEILKTTYDYLYHPSFFWSQLKESFAEEVEIDAVDCPFSVKEIETFLEMTASLPFFVMKNKLDNPGHDEVSLESEILLRKGHWRCPLIKSLDVSLCCRLCFTPYTSSLPFEKDIEFSVLMYDLSKNRLEDVKKRKKRVVTFESSIGYYTEEQFNEMPFVPREVGYNIQEQKINLKHLRISRHVKTDLFPLYLDVPIIKEYIAHTYLK